MSLVILAAALSGLVCGSIGFLAGVYSHRWSAEEKLLRRRREWTEYYQHPDDAEMRCVVKELTKPL